MSQTNLDGFLNEFEKDCDDCLSVYFNSLQLYNQQPEAFSEEMRNMLIEYIILKMFGKWERFLEKIFIEYMLGEKSQNGKAVNRYVTPYDGEHAYRMIQSVNIYPDWSDIEKVLINARNFFQDGGSFGILETMKSEITSLRKIRNAIAHTSIRAQKDFEKLVQGKVGYLPENITPAKFLIDYKAGRRRNDPTYCEYYILYLKSVAKILVEYNPEEAE